jgi:hypothetical protein
MTTLSAISDPVHALQRIWVRDTKLMHDVEVLAHDRRDERWWRSACLTILEVAPDTGEPLAVAYSTAELLHSLLKATQELLSVGTASGPIGDGVRIRLEQSGDVVVVTIDCEGPTPFVQYGLSVSEVVLMLSLLVSKIFNGAADLGVNYTPFVRAYA